MLDGIARRAVNGTLDAVATKLVSQGIKADAITIAGFVLGLISAVLIAHDHLLAALGFLAFNRIADGLDGAVARLSTPTDRGGFLDIVCDFAFYGMIPFAFALRDPTMAVPAAMLLLAFYVNGASFLGFAIMAAKRGLTEQARGPKSLYFTTGLVEGTETILFFVAMVLFPAAFPTLAYVFSALCLLTTLARVLLAWRIFVVDQSAS